MSYKSVQLYDAQKNRETGNGYHTKNLKTHDNIKDEIKKLREEQKLKNMEYKKANPKRRQNSLLQSIPLILEENVAHSLPSSNFSETEELIVSPEVEPIKNEPQRTPFKLLLDSGTGNTIFILGSSKMGKSTLLLKIYDEYYSGSEYVSILWAGNPQIDIYKKHKNLIVSGVWDKRGEKIISSQKKIQIGTKNKYQFCNMFDDVLDMRNSDLLKNLLLSYRNSKISSIISLQYPSLLQKSARANVNNVICFNFISDEAIIVVLKIYFIGYLAKLGIKSLGDQISWYKEMTKDHSFIYLKPAEGHVSFHKLSI